MTPDALARTHAEAFTDQRPWTAAEFADLLSSPHVFVVGDADSFALGRVIAGEAELLTLATAPATQGQGKGRDTLRAYHQVASTRGAQDGFLEVAETNRVAIRLYQSEGYSQTAKRPNYYRLTNGQRVAALILNRPF